VYVGSHKHAEYLKVKDAQAAAFLETLRYAAVKGAGTELRKAEGLAYNRRERVVYLAISEVGKGMLAGRSSGAGGDQIRVRSRIHGGAVYALPVSGAQRDTDGAAIESAFVPVVMHVPAGLLGSGLTAPDALGNRADPDKIANPDNLFYVDALRTLFIAEDSGLHTANVLWAYHVDTGRLTRLLSAVAGAELTGLRVHGNVSGYAYALLNAQHVGQFDSGGNHTLREAMAQIRRRWQERRRAPLGYITGLPPYGE